jgi:hypothetical protein
MELFGRVMSRWFDWNHWQRSSVSQPPSSEDVMWDIGSSPIVTLDAFSSSETMALLPFSHHFVLDVLTLINPQSIFQITRLGSKLKQDTLPLNYTPRRIAVHPSSRLFYIIAADHRTLSPAAAEAKLAEMVGQDFASQCLRALSV